jgi:hypothetical protein
MHLSASRSNRRRPLRCQRSSIPNPRGLLSGCIPGGSGRINQPSGLGIGGSAPEPVVWTNGTRAPCGAGASIYGEFDNAGMHGPNSFPPERASRPKAPQPGRRWSVRSSHTTGPPPRTAPASRRARFVSTDRRPQRGGSPRGISLPIATHSNGSAILIGNPRRDGSAACSARTPGSISRQDRNSTSGGPMAQSILQVMTPDPVAMPHTTTIETSAPRPAPKVTKLSFQPNSLLGRCCDEADGRRQPPAPPESPLGRPGRASAQRRRGHRRRVGAAIPASFPRIPFGRASGPAAGQARPSSPEPAPAGQPVVGPWPTVPTSRSLDMCASARTASCVSRTNGSSKTTSVPTTASTSRSYATWPGIPSKTPALTNK